MRQYIPSSLTLNIGVAHKMQDPISLFLPHILQGNPDIFMKKNLHLSCSHSGEELCKCVHQYHMYYYILSKCIWLPFLTGWYPQLGMKGNQST